MERNLGQDAMGQSEISSRSLGWPRSGSSRRAHNRRGGQRRVPCAAPRLRRLHSRIRLIAAFVSGQDALPGRVGYGTVQVRRCESGADFVMPDQRLPEPTESPTPAPAPQADSAQQSGAASADLMPSIPDNPAAPLAAPTSQDRSPN